MKKRKGILLIAMFCVFLFSKALLVYAEDQEAKKVNPNKEWVIRFSHKVNLNDENFKNIYVLDENNNKINTSIVAGSDATKDIGFTQNIIVLEPPQNGYEVGKNYTLVVGKDIKSNSNKKMENETTLNFTVISDEEYSTKKPQQIENPDLNVDLSIDATEEEKNMTKIEPNENVKEEVGVQGVVGQPIKITSPVEKPNATISISYNPYELNNINENDIRLFYYNPDTKKAELVQNQQLDKENHKVTACLPHFSTYLLGDVNQWVTSLNKKLIPVEESTKKENFIDAGKSDVVLLIDSSGSMGRNDYDPDCNNDINNYRISSSKTFISSLGKKDKVAIVDFDSSAYVMQEFTDNKEELFNALDRIDSNGGTDIGYGIAVSVNHILNYGRANVDKKFIVLLTDGKDNYVYSDYKENMYLQEKLELAKENSIKIYTIGLGNNIDADYLQYISDYTGGDFYYAKDSEHIYEKFNLISKEENVENNIDTDGDGIPDGIEESGYYLDGTFGKYILPTNIYEKDTDGDGFTDREELGDIWLDPASGRAIVSTAYFLNNNSNVSLTEQMTRKPYVSDPNNPDETPREAIEYLLPENFGKFNNKLAYITVNASKASYEEELDNSTSGVCSALVNNGFYVKPLINNKSIYKNVSMQALIAHKKIENDRQVILIAFRGTSGGGALDLFRDICTDVDGRKINNPYGDYDNLVMHNGFYKYTDMFIEKEDGYECSIDGKSLMEIIIDNANKRRNDAFIITGHSLGAAAAKAFSGYLKSMGVSENNIACYTYASPPLIYEGQDYYDNMNIYSVIHPTDPVVYLPTIADLKNVGVEVEIPYSEAKKVLFKEKINSLEYEYSMFGDSKLAKIFSGALTISPAGILLGNYIYYHGLNNTYIPYIESINDKNDYYYERVA